MAGSTGGEFEPAEHGLIPVHHPLEQQYKRGASWFYWIAGLTALNSLVYLLGQDLNFLIGLGITQVIDVFAEMLTTDIPEATLILRIFSIGLDLFFIGGFVLLGVLAYKKKRWPYLLGIVVYAFDSLIFLAIQDFFSFVLHLVALYGLYRGYRTLLQIQSGEELGR